MLKGSNIDIHTWILSLIGLLLLIDLLILLDIPLLRQIFGFVYFTMVPGLLILQILRLNKIEFLKKIVLSVGLSVASLMFVGLFINSLYPLILEPFAFYPILIFLNFFIIILILIAYLRNRYDFSLEEVFNFRVDVNGKLVSPLIFPILFPFMAAFGTYLMNTQGNNTILLTMLFLIPIYVVIIVYLRDKIPKATYPVTIWMIAIGLTLMHGLTCKYIIGSDIHLEYYVFQLTLNTQYWNIDNFYHPYNACLSITILPVIYQQLLNINSLYIYKLFIQLISSTIILILYILFKKYIHEEYSFLACFYFVSQGTFIFELVEHIRQEIALLFFALAILVLFDDEIENIYKKILFIIFVICVVVSHYTTTYVFLFILLFSLILTSTVFKIEDKYKNLTLSTFFLCFTIMFLWYGQMTSAPYSDAIKFFKETFTNLYKFFAIETRSPEALEAVGVGMETLLDYIRLIVRDVTYLFIGVGCFYLIKNYKKKIFEIEYISMMLASATLIFLIIVVPYVSKGYGITRLYIQALILLTPAFIIGAKVFSKSILKIKSSSTNERLSKAKKYSLIIILSVLVLQNICATTLIYNIFGVPLSVDLNTRGNYRESLYIYDREVFGAMWLAEHTSEHSIIRCDKPAYQRIYLGYEMSGHYKLPIIDQDYFANNKTKLGYVYLRVTNIELGKVNPTRIFPKSTDVRNIINYLHLFVEKNKIYSNGGVEIYWS